MLRDIQIEQSVQKLPIGEVAARLGLTELDYLPHGRFIAKLPHSILEKYARRSRGKLILVTAMTPTPSGVGKTTTTIGLADSLARLGHRSTLAIREPSLGPYFGIKGGGTGAGHAQVIPAEDINLHFTGDIAAVSKAANLLAAMIDNHLHHSNELNLDQRRITWRRVVDLNDRALREIIVGLGGPTHGVPRRDGFFITPASEVMAILCLAESFPDLRQRVRDIIFGYTRDRKPVTCDRLEVDGAMTVVLRDAILPNLVQTPEHTPALVHGGPFANIAHGCSSLLATRMGLTLCDYLVTEAGFGSDLGAEKFFDIKCRQGKLRPAAAVIVATLQSIEYHGGFARRGGWDNLRRHIDNVRQFAVEPVVAINRFPGDRARDLTRVRKACEKHDVRCEISEVHARGSKGGAALAQAVVDAATSGNRRFKLLYPDRLDLRKKIETIATRVYGASKVNFTSAAGRELDRFESMGYGHLPICMAKTPMSFTEVPSIRGAAENFEITVNDVMLSAGAGFVVAIAGQIVPMPGLPKVPAAVRIKVDDEGNLLDMA